MLLSGGFRYPSYRLQSVVTWVGPLPQEEALARPVGSSDVNIVYRSLGVNQVSDAPFHAQGLFSQAKISHEFWLYFSQNTRSTLSPTLS